MSSPNGSGRATVLWGGAVLLALAATAILVLGEDARLLRLGLLAALWAALIAALAAARLRGRVAEDDESAEQRRRVYELELEREVAARREHELEAENEARRRVAEESDTEIQRLREELRTLREALEPLLGGDVMYERVALQAEATRMRSLGEQRTGEDGSSARQQGVVPSAEEPAPVTSAPAAPAAPAASAHSAPAEPASPDSAGTRVIGRVDTESASAHPPAQDRPRQSGAQQSARPPSRGAPSQPGIDPAAAASRAPAPSRPAQSRPASQRATASRGAAEPSGEQAVREQERESTGSEWTSQVAPGAHAEGTSVTDLLAAYGDAESPRRRRRGR
ncbi:hypothetical protein FHX42_003948 [Saccharopolyspora lacisalsi]|uniref:DUF6779 domain-containing protein n=1 Tax=Halosaccharopolyspora lacisalsi TaxID=1000566 RepID=A0A839E0Y3_9PSEU|nr:DUF6779 domain-containing protein [Halosaccharopolyspora lacisalsi]MBA8826569.1 hypothetical protein [Halosaccharopolyspora lacisalsi]